MSDNTTPDAQPAVAQTDPLFDAKAAYAAMSDTIQELQRWHTQLQHELRIIEKRIAPFAPELPDDAA